MVDTEDLDTEPKWSPIYTFIVFLLLLHLVAFVSLLVLVRVYFFY